MYFIKILTSISCILIFLQGCSEDPVLCTDEFVTHAVTVLTSDGELADSVQIEINEKETDELYSCDEYLCDEIQNGSYIIMHDGFFSEISESGETFLVKGTKDGFQFEEEYIFGSGDCHVEKIAGQDTVSFAPE